MLSHFPPALLPLLFLLLLGTQRSFAQGTGLTGQYYDTEFFGTLRTTRSDATINFNFGTAIPTGTAITHADTFSIAWSGQIEPEFTALYTFFLTADDGARLWINDQMVTCRTYAGASPEMRGQMLLRAGQRVNLRLEYIEQTGSASVKLEWACDFRAREIIPTARLYPARVTKLGGALLKEHWTGLTGTGIATLTSNANYPAKPAGREFITSFECLAQDWSDSYGTRVTGFIVPQETGSYSFALSGADAVELWLSTDATSTNKSLIASVSSATAFRAWGTPSTPRILTQGQRYYVELLHKESTGTDHWSVGWMKSGDSSFSVVPGSALAQPGTTSAQPAQANLLDTMAQEHPRIFATSERFARLKAAYLNPASSQAKTWAQNAINAANAILTQAPVTYAPDVRSVILTESRLVVDRIYKLGVAYWMTDDPQYAERAWTELNTVADNTLFPNWNPNHFLDTAEMTHACAIGYDWFYHYWTQARRDTIRNAIINKGLNPGLTQFTNNAGWTRSTGNNWNQVCNGGLIMGALAVGSESEALTENILNRALNSTRPTWAHFTTDNGAWYEGPGYWGYTMEYGIRMLAALEWVLGSDFGIGTTQNLSEAGFAPMQSVGPTNIIFNYADAPASGPGRGPVFQWMARRYGLPIYDWWENQTSGSALSALWWNESSTSLVSSNQSPDMAYHGEAGTAFQPQEMVTMRGRWNDNRTTFLGCKGGEMAADHGNLDAGTFVLDALGTRWFHDLGGDNYALPNYFIEPSNPSGIDRWDYYRMRPEGQNTLTIDPSANADMNLHAVAPLLAYQSEPGGSGSFAIHDLTPVYTGVTRVWRGARLLGARDEVLIQDEIQAATGKTVWWFAHYSHPSTAVTIDPDGSSALLTKGSERLWCKILSGDGTFQVMDAVPLPTSPNPATNPAQNANTGFKKLAIQLTNVTDTTLAVWFVPLTTGEPLPTTAPAITPLTAWNIAASNDAPVTTGTVATSNGENPVDIDLRNYVTDDATPGSQLRFRVSQPVNGTVVLLADGYTARFTPTPGYSGVPSFTFTATDAGGDNANTVLLWDFDLPDSSTPHTVPDASGNGRDGTIDAAGAGTYTLGTDRPASLASQGARSIDLVENVNDARRIQRTLTATELGWNTANWSVAGWFKRRDTTNDDMIWHIGDGDGFGSTDELYLNCPTGQSTVRLQHFSNSGDALDVDITATGVSVGVWHHFAVVRNGTTISLYLNGVLIGSDSAFAFAMNQAAPLVFGGHATSGFEPRRWCDGVLDDLLVTRAVLDASQVAELASGGTVRHFGGLSTTGTISLSAAAVNYVWTNASTTGGLPWSTGANWQSGTAPSSTRGASVQFFTGQTLTGGTVTSNNDIGGSFQMNNLTLAGTATTATTVTVSGGNFALLNNGTQLPTVNLTGSGSNLLSYQINTPILLGADTTVNATNNGTFIFNGDLSGSGGLTRNSSSSRLILAGNNSYTGATVINAGTLQIGNDGANGTPGSGDILNNGTLRFDRTGTLEVTNNISGSGGVTIDCPINAGTVILSGTNSFNGNVSVVSGALRITNSSALGDGSKTVTLTNGTAGNPQLRLDGTSNPIELPAATGFLISNDTSGAIINEAGDNLIAGPVTLASGGGSSRIYVNAGTLTLTGAISPNTTGRTLKLMGAATGLITGDLSNGNATNVLPVSKEESGTWTLSGNNTFSGTTTVAAGILRIGSPSALGHGGFTFGNGNGGTSITSGATLDLNGQPNVNEVLTLRGPGVLVLTGGLVNDGDAVASIAGGVVSSISTTAGGVHSAVPEVTLSGGGGGSGATAIATLGVSAPSFTINGGTTVYSAAPTVTITGGGGTGATATAVLTSGLVTGISITNAGTGYTSAPDIAFSGGTVTTAGTNPTGTGNASNFVVSGIQVTQSGSGYTSAPSVSFSSGSGTAATANLSAVSLASSTFIGGTGDLVIHPGITGGNVGLTKTGFNTLRLNGSNTYTGSTMINSGRLILAGSLAGAVQTGIGAIFAPQGTPSVAGPIIHSGRPVLQLRLSDTTPGSGHDQLIAAGTVTLAGTLDLICGPDLAPGSTFLILNKTSSGAIAGTFDARPQNSTFTDDGYTFQISYTGGNGNDVVLTRLPNAMEQWRFTHFGSYFSTGNGADDADFDGDGLANLLEFATGLNPTTAGTLPQTTTRNGSVLEFVYPKNKAATGLTYTVEWSDTLTNDWSSADVSAPVVLSDNGSLQQIKVTVPAGPGARFIRLTVSRP